MDESAMTKREEPDDSAPGETGAGEAAPVSQLRAATNEHIRMLEAILFAASEPLDEETIADRMPEGADVPGLIAHLQSLYSTRGVNLVAVAGKWAMRTAGDLAFLMRRETVDQKRLSRAALETLAIVAYHQPVTRAEIEDIRGVTVSKGTLDLLLQIGWVKMRGKRRTPGRPVTYGTTSEFLAHFGLDSLGDLPGIDEMRLAGLLELKVPAGFNVPQPSDALAADEDPLDADELDLLKTGGDELP